MHEKGGVRQLDIYLDNTTLRKFSFHPQKEDKTILLSSLKNEVINRLLQSCLVVMAAFDISLRFQR